ncbi:hypothetical protein [Nocardia neocaledoniensis]|uniref:hypothetical protein n=1 Tax=Nocardia neocaledoniensis TaxID=236511 RepID=UPI00245766EA|nr:hypothetical protein [Nocardia neocaledoniensis]
MVVRGDRGDGAPEALPALQGLPAEEARDLFELMRSAVTFEAKALDKSIDSIMGALPRPLRAVTKKIMFGGR